MLELAEVVTSCDESTLLMVSLRSDFYGECASVPEFARLLERNQVLVGAMDDVELRQAIVAPAARVGLAVEPDLVEAVCRDAGREPGVLPLVSTALVETWSRRRGDTLTVAGYLEAGGVRGALARWPTASSNVSRLPNKWWRAGSCCAWPKWATTTSTFVGARRTSSSTPSRVQDRSCACSSILVC